MDKVAQIGYGEIWGPAHESQRDDVDAIVGANGRRGAKDQIGVEFHHISWQYCRGVEKWVFRWM